LTWAVAVLSPSGLAGAAPPEGGGALEVEIEVDARELPRRLITTTIRMPCRGGPCAVWYPRWIQGTHSPWGQVADVGGLHFEDPQGRTIPWRRDAVELHRFIADVPEGVDHLTARLVTICNESSHLRGGHLSYGNRSLGIINWNTCILYPEGTPAAALRVRPRLRLPEGWSLASALRSSGRQGDLLTFEPVSLEELVDRPLIAGEHLRSLPLDAGTDPPAVLHIASEVPAALEVEGTVAGLYGQVVREAGALFGACHYPEYHFLVTCSDELGYLGLEHLTSSINGVRQRDLLDAKSRRGWVANLIPHEYAHAWCGKYRRPVGMCTPDFHTPMKTELLWVYEGLDTYLGDLLMVRGGLVGPDEYREMLAWRLGDLLRRQGRRWRPLDDTAVASSILRAPSANWDDLRRGQEAFYLEGALLWLEADAIIRADSHGTRSLDDFCQRFMGPIPLAGAVVPYDRAEIVALLEPLAKHDWAAWFDRRVSAPTDALSLDVVARCGYRIAYSTKPSGYLEYLQELDEGMISARDSLGLTLTRDGKVTIVNAGTAADRGGLLPGMQILGVNGWRFSPKRFLQALEDTPARRRIELVAAQGDQLRNLVLEYSDGPRYLELVRDPAQPDLLGAILKPRRSR
jgi:predicted metalloprotease with PDZ domain